MIPIYRLQQNQQTTWKQLITLPLAKSAHPGLIFDKFPDGWVHNQNEIKLPDGEGGAKENFYKETAERDQEHLKDGLKHAINQQKKLVKSLSGEKIILQTDWRLITGMGNSHPYETGFIWHQTLGVPYLPGSTVKGMLRDWIIQWTEEEEKEVANRLLGCQNTKGDLDNKEDSVGNIIIFDALPIKLPKLEVDVLTPHYQPYYENQQKNYAGDYYNPVPIKFLTISEGQSFQFSIAPRTINTPEEDLKLCEKLLIEALENIGIGGKTAVGYGYFTKKENSEYSGDQALIYEIVSSYTGNDAKLYLSKKRNKAIEQLKEKLDKFNKQNWLEYIQLIKDKFPDDILEWEQCTDKNNLMFKANKAITMSWVPSEEKYTD